MVNKISVSKLILLIQACLQLWFVSTAFSSALQQVFSVVGDQQGQQSCAGAGRWWRQNFCFAGISHHCKVWLCHSLKNCKSTIDLALQKLIVAFCTEFMHSEAGLHITDWLIQKSLLSNTVLEDLSVKRNPSKQNLK